MKVLLVAGKSEQGGAPRSMLELMKNIKDKYGVEYVVLAHKEGKITQFCNEYGIDYCVDGHEPIVISRGSTPIRRMAKSILRPWYSYKSKRNNSKAIRIIESKVDLSSIDLIHTNSNRDGIGALLSKKHSIKHIWHLREFGKEDYDTVFLPPYDISYMNNAATCFVAISQALAQAWKDKGLETSKISQIYNGINMFQIDSDSERKMFLDNKIRMVFTGTICPAKGQSELIEAMGMLSEECRKSITVDLYGDGANEYISSLKKRVTELKLEKQVNFCGFCNNVGAILKNYNVGVVCSRAEAFGRITPEYMAAGLVVVASNSGANPELVEDGHNGFLYRLGDCRNLAEVLERIYRMSNEERLIISRCAEEGARKKYTAEKNAENIYSLYKKVLSK